MYNTKKSLLFARKQPNLHKFGSFFSFKHQISQLFTRFSKSCITISQLYRKIAANPEKIRLIEKNHHRDG